jgi:hypothetical protein
MSAGSFLRAVLSLAIRFADSDKDGQLELSDIPGTLKRLAELRGQGLDMAATAVSMVERLKAMAIAGQVTQNGVPVTPEDLAGKWEAAKDQFSLAADEARAALAKE